MSLNLLDSWQPLGNPMNTFRGGAAFTRMGRFIVVTGHQNLKTPF